MSVQERRQALWQVLSMHNESMPITMTSLSELLHVSVRTISSDIDALADETAKSGIRILRKSGLGVWTEGAGEPMAALPGMTGVLSSKERRDAIILYLLSGTTYTSETLATALSISRNTFLEDLKTVKETLAKYHLSYQSRRGEGIWAEGGEQETRDMLIHIFAKGNHDFKHYATETPEECSYAYKAFRQFSSNLPVKELAAAFLALMKRWGILENDDSVNRMICALVVQLARLHTGHFIDQMSGISFLSDEGNAVKELAGEIASLMAAYAPDASRKAEQEYLVKELLHSKIFVFPKCGKTLAKSDVNVRALSLARRFIQYAQIWLGDFYLDDDDLIYNLAMHLQPAIERAHFGIILTNPLLGKIKDRYQSLYAVAKRAAERIGETEGIHFSEDEIGYMTIHLGAAVERKKLQRTKRLSVLLVCGNGIGTANLLAMTLKSRLPYINITKTVSFYKLQDEDCKDADLVISTAPVELPDQAVLHVSPIMTQEEIDVISGQIEYFHKQKFAEENAAPVCQELGLPDLLSVADICLDFHAASWEDAIRQSGALLAASGAVTQTYVDRMVQCVREMGAYIVVRPGIAMPHAGFEDGVHRVAVSFLRLAAPVEFSASKDAQADLFFAFSTTDEKSHQRLLEDLWQLFQDTEALQKLRKLQEKQEILSFLRKFIERR